MLFKVYSKFYYSKLTDEEKRIYRRIAQGWDYCLRSVRIPAEECSDTKIVQKIISYIKKDIPEFFYVKITGTLFASRNDGSLDIITNYVYSKSEITALRKKLRQCVDKIISRISGDFEEKVSEIHDYLVRNVTYRLTESIECRTVVGALLRGEGVCSSISAAFKLLCDELRIPSIIITGRTPDKDGSFDDAGGVLGGNHCWNIVRDIEHVINFHVDCTWDISEIPDARRFYFLVSDKYISCTHHFVRDDFYPVCEKTDKTEDGIAYVDSTLRLDKVLRKGDPIIIRFSNAFAPRSKESFRTMMKRSMERMGVKKLVVQYFMDSGIALLYGRTG